MRIIRNGDRAGGGEEPGLEIQPFNTAEFSVNKDPPLPVSSPRRNFEFATAIRSISDCSLSVEFLHAGRVT